MMEQRNRKKISIIIPVYNVEEYLEECLNSVYSQNISDYEVICINDCSTDRSANILQRYKNKYNNLSVINHNINMGLSISRNHGIAKASGEYILFLDSDDILQTGLLAKLYDIAKKNLLDILGFEYKKTSDDGIYIRDHQETRYNNYNKIVSGKVYFEDMVLERELVVMVWQFMFSLDFIKKNNILFQPGMKHEDYLFTFYSLMNAERVMVINDVIYNYRKRSGSITDKLDYSRSQALFFIMLRVFNYGINNSGCNSRFESAINKFIVCLYSNFKNKIDNISEEDKRKQYELGTATENMLYQYLLDEKRAYRYVYFDDESIIKIQKARVIYIYGAGAVGKEVERYLRDNGIYAKLFLVSNANEAGGTLRGIEIVKISNELLRDRDILVIVAARPNVQDVMIETLTNMGFSNYVHV